MSRCGQCGINVLGTTTTVLIPFLHEIDEWLKVTFRKITIEIIPKIEKYLGLQTGIFKTMYYEIF